MSEQLRIEILIALEEHDRSGLGAKARGRLAHAGSPAFVRCDVLRKGAREAERKET